MVGNAKQSTSAQLAYTVESNRRFEEIVSDVEKKIQENGFRVLYVHDVQKTMQDKGFEFSRYKIIEMCNAKLAHDILLAEMEIGLMIPCKINVYEKGGKRYVSGMLPTLISDLYPKVDLGSAPDEVETIIKKIIDEVK